MSFHCLKPFSDGPGFHGRIHTLYHSRPVPVAPAGFLKPTLPLSSFSAPQAHHAVSVLAHSRPSHLLFSSLLTFGSFRSFRFRLKRLLLREAFPDHLSETGPRPSLCTARSLCSFVARIIVFGFSACLLALRLPPKPEWEPLSASSPITSLAPHTDSAASWSLTICWRDTHFKVFLLLLCVM